MPAPQRPDPRSRRPIAAASVRAITLVEVMMASTVLLLGIVTAITTLQRGLAALDTSRNLTQASQLMQAEIERLRLKSWTQLEAIQASAENEVANTSTRFRCYREIRDLRPGMKEIVLRAEWPGLDGRPQVARLITRYSRSGLNDYFYTTH